MRLISTRRLVRLGIGAIVLLLVQGVLAPDPARAGCNHLVGSEARKSPAIAHLDDLITGMASPSPRGDLAGGLPGRPEPVQPLRCSGPSCSGRAPLPPSPAFSGMENPDHWGLLSFDLLDLARSAVRDYRDCEPFLHLSGEPSRIFHPPRPSA